MRRERNACPPGLARVRARVFFHALLFLTAIGVLAVDNPVGAWIATFKIIRG